MSRCVSPWTYSVWDSLCFLNLSVSFPILGTFSTLISSNFFFWLFLSSPYGTPMMCMLACLMLSQRSLSSFHSFFFILFYGSDFHHSVFYITYPSCSSVILLLIPSDVFFTLDIVLFILVYLIFKSSSSLSNTSFNFSICVSLLFQYLGSSTLSSQLLFWVDCLSLHQLVVLCVFSCSFV